VPTNIGFPDNAGIAVRTTGIAKFILRYVHTNGSRGNFNWVRSSAISPTALHISGGFRQPTFLCHNLCARNYLRNREDVKAWFHTRRSLPPLGWQVWGRGEAESRMIFGYFSRYNLVIILPIRFPRRV
jgi:hypothetical protein